MYSVLLHVIRFLVEFRIHFDEWNFTIKHLIFSTKDVVHDHDFMQHKKHTRNLRFFLLLKYQRLK